LKPPAGQEAQGENVFFEPSKLFVPIALSPCVFLGGNPFAGNGLKSVFNFRPGSGLDSLLVCSRVNAFGKQLLCFFTFVPFFGGMSIELVGPPGSHNTREIKAPQGLGGFAGLCATSSS
jgi:hypothetical protein